MPKFGYNANNEHYGGMTIGSLAYKEEYYSLFPAHHRHFTINFYTPCLNPNHIGLFNSTSF